MKTDVPTGELAALILAAGFSRRLGRPKASVRLPSGETLLAHAAQTARDAGLQPWVTVPASGEVTDAAAQAGVGIVHVAEPREGMAASIRAGIGVLSARPAIAGVVILLVDQWRVTGDDLRRLIGAWQAGGQRVAAAQYAGTAGVPALFSRDYFGMLVELKGDAGARDFLRSGDAAITLVEMPAAAADVDLPADVAALSFDAADPVPDGGRSRATGR